MGGRGALERIRLDFHSRNTSTSPIVIHFNSNKRLFNKVAEATYDEISSDRYISQI